jgi:hypothetical protein
MRTRALCCTVAVTWLLLVWTAPRAAAQANRPPDAPTAVPSEDLRRNGPPADRPADDAGQAPGPGLFYVPGEYYPDGNGVAWKPGFWARSQPGWTWMPAHWSRDSDGWSFQEGRWVRARGAAGPAPERESRTSGDATSVTPAPVWVSSAIYPSSVYASYLWNPNLIYGLGFPYGGIGGFGGGLAWYGGYGFGGFGAVTPFYTAGFRLGYPYWGGWGGIGGWGGFGGWPGYWW